MNNTTKCIHPKATALFDEDGQVVAFFCIACRERFRVERPRPQVSQNVRQVEPVKPASSAAAQSIEQRYGDLRLEARQDKAMSNYEKRQKPKHQPRP